MIKLSIMTTTTAVTSISHLGNDRFCWDGWEVVGALAAGVTAAGAGLGAAGWGGADGVGVGYVGPPFCEVILVLYVQSTEIVIT